MEDEEAKFASTQKYTKSKFGNFLWVWMSNYIVMNKSDRTPTMDKSVLDDEEKTKKIEDFFKKNSLNTSSVVRAEIEKYIETTYVFLDYATFLG